MHTIVTTPGFIIDSRAYGEADRLYSIFTRDQGLIRAVAQGIRLEKSKLRYHVRENEPALFSLVRGREVWRLTNAQEIQAAKTSSASLELLARVSLLLRRVLHGEEPNPALFEHIEKCTYFLNANNASGTRLIEDELQAVESLVVLRILHSLGYIGGDVEIQEYLTSSEISPDLLAKAGHKRATFNKHINRAIKESHL